MNRSIIFRKSLLMTFKVWNYGFTLIFIWMMLSFCMMLWNFGINLSLALSAIFCISVFFIDWHRCYRKIYIGIKSIGNSENIEEKNN